MGDRQGISVEDKRLLNVKEVAALLGISVRTVWAKSGCGEIPAPLKIGRSTRWSKTALERWIDRQQQKAQRRQLGGQDDEETRNRYGI